VLIHCFAGCELPAILAVLGLSQRDLFQSQHLSLERVAALLAEREARERERQIRRAAQRAAWDEVRQWEAVVNVLGAKLARATDDDALGDLFHMACHRLRDAENAAGHLTECKTPAH
jgi:hypothetical protein